MGLFKKKQQQLPKRLCEDYDLEAQGLLDVKIRPITPDEAKKLSLRDRHQVQLHQLQYIYNSIRNYALYGYERYVIGADLFPETVDDLITDGYSVKSHQEGLKIYYEISW